jgi:hypothetical protein
MLTMVRPLSEMLSLKLGLMAFPIPSAGAGQLGSSPWMMVFSSV